MPVQPGSGYGKVSKGPILEAGGLMWYSPLAIHLSIVYNLTVRSLHAMHRTSVYYCGIACNLVNSWQAVDQGLLLTAVAQS